jgi:hypothetical protein
MSRVPAVDVLVERAARHRLNQLGNWLPDRDWARAMLLELADSPYGAQGPAAVARPLNVAIY